MKHIAVTSIILTIIFSPIFVFAGGEGFRLIPECGVDTVGEGENTVPGDPDGECNFDHLIELFSNIITFLVMLSIPLAVIAFTYAGFLIVTSAGNPGQISKAKEIFKKVAIGFLFVLTAWLIVYLITSVLLEDEAKTLLEQTNN